MSDLLDRLTREAREAPVPKVDWQKVDDALMARVRAEVAAQRRTARAASSSRIPWVPATLGLAAAAAFALFVGRAHDRSPDAVKVVDRSAGALVEGSAVVSGRPKTPGAKVALGDAVEARGGRAVFLRPAGAGRPEVRYVVEADGRATVTGVEGPLVLSLDEGSVEAQVGADSESDAFAVDVGEARVAGQGMHLRVSRQSDYAVVDVSEGAVSIGAPSRSSELVSAPAHVEFVPGNATSTMRVDHPPVAQAPVEVAAPTPSAPLAQLMAPRPTAAPAPPAASQREAPVAALDPNPEGTLAQAVRACLAARSASPDVVAVTVSTELDLRLNDDGTVQLARFSPPIAPEAQACATATIYRARFSHGGTAHVAIDYQK